MHTLIGPIFEAGSTVLVYTQDYATCAFSVLIFAVLHIPCLVQPSPLTYYYFRHRHVLDIFLENMAAVVFSMHTRAVLARERCFLG